MFLHHLALKLRFWLGLASVFAFTTGSLLMAATVIPRIAIGVDPTVVLTGSMQPSIRPGDIVLVDEGDDAADPSVGSVIKFEEGGDGTIIHRVAEVRDDGYVTRGDANPTSDPGVRSPGDVLGIGVAVVPLVGLPVHWWIDDNREALALLALGAFLACLSLASGGLQVDPWARTGRAMLPQRGPFTARTLRDDDTLPEGLVPDGVAQSLASAGVTVTNGAEVAAA